MKAYIIITSAVTVNGKTFAPYQQYTLVEKRYGLVTNPCCNDCTYQWYFTFTVDGVQYEVSDDYVVETDDVLSDAQQYPYKDFASRHQDPTIDYFKAVEERMGIDIKKAYAPQHEISDIRSLSKGL